MAYDPETIEAVAQIMCSLCSSKKLRWRDRSHGMFVHQAEFHDQEATECEADGVLQAALELDIGIDTGAHLSFPPEEQSTHKNG